MHHEAPRGVARLSVEGTRAQRLTSYNTLARWAQLAHQLYTDARVFTSCTALSIVLDSIGSSCK